MRAAMAAITGESTTSATPDRLTSKKRLAICERFRVSGDPCKRNVGIELEALQLETADSYGVEQRLGLARPDWIVQLVKGDDRAPRHARQELLQRHFGWLIEVEVQEQQAHDQVRMLTHELRNHLHRVALEQVN